MSDEKNLGQQFGEIPDEVKREHLRRSFASCCDAGRKGVTLTDAEREAVERAIQTLDGWQRTGGYHSAIDDDAATLRGLLERLR